jgi:alkylation response protein AidB-like acyl-CoA dehydrogenase
MDFNWTPQQQDFRRRVRAAVEEMLPADWEEKSNFDTGSQYVSEFSRWFCPQLAERGLLIPHWPKKYGGEGLDPFHHWILGEELFVVGEPRSYQYMNVNWAGPAILKFGTPDQCERLVTEICAGTRIWCQGWSEPGAGSDLAAMKTRAVRTDRGYVINGQKIWTSGASLADYNFLLARTGDGRKEISVFLVPMSTPGIDVRIIPNFNGQRSFHEVFLSDVEVPHDALLGEEGGGWPIVLSVLHNERIGLPRYTLTMRGLEHAVQCLREDGRFDSRAQEAAGIARAACEAARNLCLKVVNERSQGREPGPDTFIARYALVWADRKASDLIGSFLGDRLVANDDPLLSATYRRAASAGIAAGSAEMQLNTISRDLLGLPRGR